YTRTGRSRTGLASPDPRRSLIGLPRGAYPRTRKPLLGPGLDRGFAIGRSQTHLGFIATRGCACALFGAIAAAQAGQHARGAATGHSRTQWRAGVPAAGSGA